MMNLSELNSVTREVNIDWAIAEARLHLDFEEQLGAQGLSVVRYLPYQYMLSAVVVNADKTKWLHVTTTDIRCDTAWADHVRLRRMSSERDWKGDVFHFVPWSEVGEAALRYFGDEYDDEIL